MNQTCAIIVTYNADVEILDASISAIKAQTNQIYIIDNGSSNKIEDFLNNQKLIKCVFLHENIGVAAAFNIGIKMARDAGYKYVLLLDQDSIPPDGMVNRFCEAIEDLTSTGIRVSGVGPRYRDPRTHHTSRFVSFKWFHFGYNCGSKNKSIIPADFLISSGSLYELSVFNHVGLFNEELFIDHVDTEWFHRARSLGYQAFGVWDIIMEHSLGESVFCMWLFRWRNQPIHKPFRLYYIIRNSLLMYRMSHTSLKWISGDVFRLLRLITVYIIFSPHRKNSIGFIHKGLVDGLNGVTGPMLKN